MPSKSKQQQKFMGLVHAFKKGDVPASKVSNAVKKAAKSMSDKSVRKYAKTKHDELPKKVTEDVGKDFPWANEKELKLISKFIFLSPQGIDGVIKMMKKDPSGFKKMIKKGAKAGLHEKRDYKAEYRKFQSSPKMKKYRAELNKYNRQKGTYGNGDGKDASHKGGKIVGFESQSKNRGRAEKSRLKKESMNEQEMSIKDAFKDLVKDHGSKKALDILTSVLTGGIGFEDPKKKKKFQQKLLKKMTTEAKYKGYDYKRQKRKNGLSLIVPALRKTFSDMKDLKKYIDKHGTMESKLNENPAAIAAAQRMVVQNRAGSKVSVNTARQSSYAKKDPSAHKKAKSMWQRIKDKFSKKESVSEKINPEMKKIYKLLLKYGNSEKDAAKMIKKNYDYVAKKYKNSTPRNKAVVLVGLQAMGESVNESAELEQLVKKFIPSIDKMLKDKIKSIGKKDRQQALKLMKIYKDHWLEFSIKAKQYMNEGTCGYGVDGKLGKEPAGPHLLRKKKKYDVNEAKDPDVIKQMRDVLKNGYSSVKDPVSGKKMKVDTYTASAITKVYDAINTSNKKKFSKLPILKMQSIAMKFVK